MLRSFIWVTGNGKQTGREDGKRQDAGQYEVVPTDGLDRSHLNLFDRECPSHGLSPEIELGGNPSSRLFEREVLLNPIGVIEKP